MHAEPTQNVCVRCDTVHTSIDCPVCFPGVFASAVDRLFGFHKPLPFVACLFAGMALVSIPTGLKSPKGVDAIGWDTEARAIRDEFKAAKINGSNLGIAHRWCGTCALDVDDYTIAEPWLQGYGIDLPALLSSGWPSGSG